MPCWPPGALPLLPLATPATPSLSHTPSPRPRVNCLSLRSGHDPPRLLKYLVFYTELWEKFAEIDTSGDGRLTEEEFVTGCAVVGGGGNDQTLRAALACSPPFVNWRVCIAVRRPHKRPRDMCVWGVGIVSKRPRWVVWAK